MGKQGNFLSCPQFPVATCFTQEPPIKDKIEWYSGEQLKPTEEKIDKQLKQERDFL